jgi:hypothetical protein
VATEQREDRHALGNSVPSASAEEFAGSLKRRGQAARGLEQDMLTEVPPLYGSPGAMEPGGDPGILLTRLHQGELLRRNGGGAAPSSGRRSDVSLPFENMAVALPFVLLLLLVLLG